jgi:o-succinylbenzoate synthase
MLEVKIVTARLLLKNPFRIAHGSYDYRENVFLQVRHGQKTAYGEAPVVPYYGISQEQILNDLQTNLRPDMILERRTTGVSDQFLYSVSASAFTSAILSLQLQDGHSSINQLLAIDPAGAAGAAGAGGAGKARTEHKVTSFTIAYHDDIDQMIRTIAACGFSTVKVKVGIPGDIERIGRIRETFPALRIRVDANQGWTFNQACAALPALEKLGVELIEEPMAGTPAQLKELASLCQIPILLDETIQHEQDLTRYRESVSGIVVKLAKSGGPQAARAMMAKAQELGLSVMLSSMVESSLGVACALALAPLCTWLDLDAPLLLNQDLFSGLSYVNEQPIGSLLDIIPSDSLKGLFDSAPVLLMEQ